MRPNLITGRLPASPPSTLAAAPSLRRRPCAALLPRVVAAVLIGACALPTAAQDWTVLPLGTTQDFQDVFRDQFNFFWVVGDSGYVFKSDAARTSFTRIDVGTTARLTSFVSPSSIKYETGGAAGAFYFSPNGTTGWVSRPIPDATQDYFISTTGSSTALASGSAGTLYRTSNNGQAWTEQAVPVVVPLHGALGETLVVGDDGILLAFSGGVWEQRPTGTSADLYAIASGGTGTQVIVGEGGTTLRVTGGVVSVSASGTTATLRDVATSGQNARFLVAVGDGGTAIKTTDSGATWCMLDTGTTTDLLGVAMSNNSEYVAVGAGGLVIRTTNGGGACVPPVAAEDAPGTAALLLSAAPSPTHGRVTLSFTLARAESARLTIHDALGRTVAVVTDGLLAAGRHTADLDTAPLASGLYVARLTTAHGRAVRQVTIVR